MSAYKDMDNKRLWDIVNSALFAAEVNSNQQTIRGRAYLRLADSAVAIHAIQLCEELREKKASNED